MRTDLFNDILALVNEIADRLGFLTKRERFAMAAMQGILASDTTNRIEMKVAIPWAVQHADSLIDELERTK